MKVYVALSALLLLGACTTTPSSNTATANAGSAPSAEGQAVAAAGAAKDSGPRKRCETVQVTGSRFGRRVCHTQEEWDRMRDASSEGMREIQRMPVGNNESN